MTEPRVLQVLGSSAGGVARHVAQVTLAAHERGVPVVVAGPASLQHLVTSAGRVRFRAVEITDRPGARDVAALLRLRELATSTDVVHAHGLRAGALVVLACRSLPRRPAVVVTLHNLPVGGRAVTAVAAVLERVVARGAQTVLGVSGDLVARARDRGARVTARALVPAPARAEPAATRAQVRESLGLAAVDHLLVTVARLAPQKGLDLLCDVAALLGPGLLWVVAGEGPVREDLAARIEAQRLPVRLLGRREDVADLMGAADLVISTARWEGQPLGVQEALAVGAAVVATDVGGTREVTGAAAVLVEPDAQALASAVSDLLAAPERRAALGRAARVRAAELPDLDATMRQLVAVWHEAATRR